MKNARMAGRAMRAELLGGAGARRHVIPGIGLITPVWQYAISAETSTFYETSFLACSSA
jgi:hypothetical protein